MVAVLQNGGVGTHLSSWMQGRLLVRAKCMLH